MFVTALEKVAVLLSKAVNLGHPPLSKINIAIFSRIATLSGASVRELLLEEGLTDYVTCLPWCTLLPRVKGTGVGGRPFFPLHNGFKCNVNLALVAS